MGHLDIGSYSTEGLSVGLSGHHKRHVFVKTSFVLLKVSALSGHVKRLLSNIFNKLMKYSG